MDLLSKHDDQRRAGGRKRGIGLVFPFVFCHRRPGTGEVSIVDSEPRCLRRTLTERGKNQEVVQAVPKVLSKCRSVIQEAKLKLSLTEGGKEGKNRLLASTMFLESRIFGTCKHTGIGVTDSVEYLGLDFRKQRRGIMEKNEVCKKSWF